MRSVASSVMKTLANVELMLFLVFLARTDRRERAWDEEDGAEFELTLDGEMLDSRWYSQSFEGTCRKSPYSSAGDVGRIAGPDRLLLFSSSSSILDSLIFLVFFSFFLHPHLPPRSWLLVVSLVLLVSSSSSSGTSFSVYLRTWR